MRFFAAVPFCLTVAALCLAPATALAQAPAAQSAADRGAALNTLFKDIFEDELKHSPEFASAIGDLRYNDQLSDLSPRAVNDEVAARQNFLNRLILIDTTGLTEQQKLAADLMQRDLIQDQEAAPFKEWEMPVNQFHGIQTDLPGLVDELPFATVKDYDDYIARLHLIPRQLRQASENLLSGINDGHVQPADVIEKALKQTEDFATQAPDASPFAAPLKKFPAAVPANSRKRIAEEMLEAIQTDVLPAYARFAKFLRVTELPAARNVAAGADPAGHPLSFTTEELNIVKLRAKAEVALGPKFDLKAFHDLVASAFFLPSDAQEQRVNAWIAATK